MHPPANLFEFERSGDRLVVRPITNLGEFEFGHINVEATKLLEFLDQHGLRNVEMDFHRCEYFGSSAVGALIRIANAVRERGGEMVLSNLSQCEREILEVLHLQNYWTIKGSTNATTASSSRDV